MARDLKAPEIADIDGQNLPDAMDIHACRQSGVVDLYTLNVKQAKIGTLKRLS